jgi:cytochrome c oxidase accessory protein FixG
MSTPNTNAIQPVAKPPVKPGRKPALEPRTPDTHYHRSRRLIQILCFIVFLVLPFFNVMRFDIPRQRFYFAGYELWINEFAIIFFALLFLLYIIAAASMLYGRVYCGYLCPQMIFSEASLGIEDRIKRFINKRFIRMNAKKRNLISRVLFYSALTVGSVFLAFVFIAYFVEPRDLLGRLFSFDIVTAGGIAGAATTLVTFLDFAFVRQRFCTTICPYGYLQGMFSDRNTLIVQYRDNPEAKDCIECKKCVRVCHMGIDIRKSPYQMECIHCGECVDACEDVLARFGKKGLIHYAWGESGELLTDTRTPLLRRLGFRDIKRMAVVLILLFYASGLVVALSMRHNVLVRVAPVRATLFRQGEDGRIYNQFRMTIANRQNLEAEVRLTLENLAGAEVLLEQPLKLQPGETIEKKFEIVAPAGSLPAGVNHFRLRSQSTPDGDKDAFDMTFITPMGKGMK